MSRAIWIRPVVAIWCRSRPLKELRVWRRMDSRRYSSMERRERGQENGEAHGGDQGEPYPLCSRVERSHGASMPVSWPHGSESGSERSTRQLSATVQSREGNPGAEGTPPPLPRRSTGALKGPSEFPDSARMPPSTSRTRPPFSPVCARVDRPNRSGPAVRARTGTGIPFLRYTAADGPCPALYSCYRSITFYSEPWPAVPEGPAYRARDHEFWFVDAESLDLPNGCDWSKGLAAIGLLLVRSFSVL